MKFLYIFDEDGYYVSPVLDYDVDRLDISWERVTEIPPPELFRAKFEDGQWIEGADEEYLESIKTPPQESPMDVIMEQNAFLIMELAETKLTNEFLIGQQTELLRFIADKFDSSPPIVRDDVDETPSEETPSQPPPDENSPNDGSPSEPDENEQPESEEPTEPIEEGENG